MNSGAEGVETAIKLARKWGYLVKKIPKDEAIILACSGNFHGRTIGTISMSTSIEATGDFGPLLSGVGAKYPGCKNPIRFGNIEDIEMALSKHASTIAAFLIEPIQGEGGYYLIHLNLV